MSLFKVLEALHSVEAMSLFTVIEALPSVEAMSLFTVLEALHQHSRSAIATVSYLSTAQCRRYFSSHSSRNISQLRTTLVVNITPMTILTQAALLTLQT